MRLKCFFRWTQYEENQVQDRNEKIKDNLHHDLDKIPVREVSIRQAFFQGKIP